MRKRKRIDWDEEMRKTEEIRSRGFRTSVLSFFVAIMFMVGANRLNEEFSIYPYLIMGACLFTAVVVMVTTLRRSAKKQKDDD